MEAHIYGDKAEKHLHSQAIEDISLYYNLPIDQVMLAYEQELARISNAARVRIYLPILIRRRMKVILKGEIL
ncbi:hypothetical protein DS62_05015 [Smithella sp. SC_K08D17]|jgi:hypothetical protein|nr:hypothetical protein KD27_07225 [Smithella sp. D17]KIE18004.1 hypothetical protein DS62_05015 [Smithella sp. SC_K08D17]MDD5523710.1 DUF3562 domain-containing protein [Smithella sp.]